MKNSYTEYSKTIGNTPQTSPLPNRTDQVKNNAGGYVFGLSIWDYLDRFLILGSEKPTYYASAKKLTSDNCDNMYKCLKEDYVRTIDRIVEFSTTSRAMKNDTCLFALSLCASTDDAKITKYAFSKLNSVARTGTHLLNFADYINNQRGWGRGVKTAFSNWYLDKTADDLAFQLAKYQSRDGWSHRDVLRKCHAHSTNAEINDVLRWAVGKNDECDRGLIGTRKTLLNAKTSNDVISIIENSNAQREIIPTEWLADKNVWAKLYKNLGYTALIRNLGVMSKNGCLAVGNFETIKDIVSRITNVNMIKKSRVHPFQILTALVAYQGGGGYRSSATWSVVPQIVDALQEAFKLSFGNVVPTGKRVYHALDVSSSMTGAYIGNLSMMTAAFCSAALAIINVQTETDYIFKGFSHTLVDLPISKNTTIKELSEISRKIPFGSTDCSQPMLDAIKNNYKVDAFVVYTDSETYCGHMHVSEALKKYRKHSGIDAKMIVIGMTSTGFSIADPTDKGCLDIVGFDSNCPQLISDFIRD